MKTSGITHFLIGAGVIVVPALISLLASPAAQHFLSKHPAEALYLPLATGALAAVYNYLKKKEA